MPRHDDHNGSCRLYVGRLSSRTRSGDLERLFSRYGRVRDVEMKRDFAFVEFRDPRDADDARRYLDGRDFDGSRITVEPSRDPRDNGGRGPPPGTDCCFNCGLDGHWARNCTAGDWKNKCYRCGESGHIERICRNSRNPNIARRSGRYARSPVKYRSPRRRRGPSRSRSNSQGRSYRPSGRYDRSPVKSRSPCRRRGPGRRRSNSEGLSYSRSRSPVKRERGLEDRSHSPKAMDLSVSPKDKDQSLSPYIITDGSPEPEKQDGSDNEASPNENGNGRNSESPIVDGEESPVGLNGEDSRSPIDDDSEPNSLSPKAN